MKEKEKRTQSLEDFLMDLNERITEETEKHLEVGTLLTDLVDELGILIRGLYAKAMTCSDAAKILLQDLKIAVETRDNDKWMETHVDSCVLKGRIEAYVEAAKLVQELCEKVMGRKDETKH